MASSSPLGSAGFYHSCGIRNDGTVTCWGDNTYGQLNPPAGAFIQVSAGSDYTCGLNDGSLACWELNDSSEAAPPAS